MSFANVEILLIEDNASDARLLKELLRDEGSHASDLRLTHVHCLKDGLTLLGSRAQQLVLLDLTLPDAEGVQTVEKIRQVAPEVPIIVLTGLDDEGVATRAVQEGAQDYLVKGQVTGLILVRAVRYAIERKRAEVASRRLLLERTARAEAEASESRMRLLSDVSRLLTSSLDENQLIESACASVIPALADGCAIDVVDANGLRRAGSAGIPTPSLAELNGHLNLRAFLQEGAPKLVEWGAASGQGAAHVFVVPLIGRGRPWGAWTFYRTPLRRFVFPEQQLARELGSRAALALDNVRLYREARHASMVRDEIMGVVSHDLRNPLQVISSAVSLLKLEATSERQKGHLEKVRRAVKQANRLIQDLLDVTRMEAGGFSVSPSSCDLSSLLEESVEQFRPLAAEQGLSLELEVPDKSEVLHVDRARIGQVLGNLIGNSIKFTGKGGRIAVRARMAAGEAVISVSDNGCGISREHLSHVFDRFWQADPTRRKGAGLGLAIVKGIVAAHGGRVWVESELGQGTTFFFTLPLEQQASPRELTA